MTTPIREANETTQLLPCPACGTEPDCNECPFPMFRTAETPWVVACAKSDECSHSAVGRTRADAISQWNKRPHLDSLAQRVAELEFESRQGWALAKGYQREMEQAEARAERLAEALRRYGVHDQACVAANIPICTCGLDAALEQEEGRG